MNGQLEGFRQLIETTIDVESALGATGQGGK